jgi:hypothetical protein
MHALKLVADSRIAKLIVKPVTALVTSSPVKYCNAQDHVYLLTTIDNTINVDIMRSR